MAIYKKKKKMPLSTTENFPRDRSPQKVCHFDFRKPETKEEVRESERRAHIEFQSVTFLIATS